MGWIAEVIADLIFGPVVDDALKRSRAHRWAAGIILLFFVTLLLYLMLTPEPS